MTESGTAFCDLTRKFVHIPAQEIDLHTFFSRQIAKCSKLKKQKEQSWTVIRQAPSKYEKMLID